MSATKSNDNPLVGSCHKFSDGYGYGQRYLTARNQLTVPCSVPVIRHPPPDDRFLRVTAPTKLIGDDSRAERRNADQIMFQTSGEVGRFYIDPESQGVKLGKSPLKPIKHSIEPKFNLGMSFPEPARALPPSSSRSNASSRLGDGAFLQQSSRVSARDESFSSSGTMPQGRLNSAQYMATLQTLDRSFSNINRRDLFAASMPSRSAQELVWCAANNNKGAQASKTWAERLRKQSSS